MKYRFGLLEEESRHEGKEYDYKIVVLISTILVTNVLMISTSAAQDKTSGFSNKDPESIMIPDAVKTRVDDPKFLMQAGCTRFRPGRYSD